MRLVRPHLDERMQPIYVELEYEVAHDVVNGAISGVLAVTLLGAAFSVAGFLLEVAV